ncbi:unnamed protein product [Orchesella dallaii]|uniref:Gustatory receptor n=1 Tax=Orchesella dallaii TaxID=48710 RepID=A0ABP1QVU0_9HEXA
MLSGNNPADPPQPPEDSRRPSNPKQKRPKQGGRRRSNDSSNPSSDQPQADTNPMGAPFQPPVAPLPQEKKASNDTEVEPLPLLSPPVQEKAIEELKTKSEVAVEVEVPAEPVEIDYVAQWMHSFLWIRIFLIIFGRWPFTYVDEEKKGYRFKFTWKCFGFLSYLLTTLFTIYGLIAAAIHVVDVLMNEKIRTIASRSKTEVLEQALMERHTMILIIILGSYIVNTVTSVFIFVRRQEIADSLTKWIKFLHSAKLSGGTMKTYSYVGLAIGNYIFISIVLFFLTFTPNPARTSTLIGGPTVVAMLFMRHFNPRNYLEDFVGTPRHQFMHVIGAAVFFYVVTISNAFMYLFLWLLKSIETALSAWNSRMATILELTAEELKSQNTKDRTTYEALYNDHIGIVRMLSWTNNIFAYSLEIHVLNQTIRIVYQLYLAAIVLDTNGDKVKYANVGKFFIRPMDQLPALLITYENIVLMIMILMASSYLEDTAYESYEDLRKKSLLRGTYNERESFFYLSMFQSFTSTTKMAIYGGHFFCVDRYTILHVLSAIMSNFLVVYQFRPLFDLDTVDNENWRTITGDFLVEFEGLPPNHTHPTAE